MTNRQTIEVHKIAVDILHSIPNLKELTQNDPKGNQISFLLTYKNLEGKRIYIKVQLT